MPRPSTPHLTLVLFDRRDGGRLAVEFGAFVRFSHAIDEDLNRLVARWIHAAAPRASNSHRRRRNARWR